MRRISEWFDKHMKVRIALQLVLDGLPFVIFTAWFAIAFAEIEEVITVPQWLDVLMMGGMFLEMFGGVAVLFAIGIWLRSRAVVAFECYPWCKGVSLALRCLSFIPAAISFGFLIGISVHLLKSI